MKPADRNHSFRDHAILLGLLTLAMLAKHGFSVPRTEHYADISAKPTATAEVSKLTDSAE